MHISPRKDARRAKEAATDRKKDSTGCAQACEREGAPGPRRWCAKRTDDRPARCLCADLCLAGYTPDDADWLGLDLRTCADHYTKDHKGGNM